MLLAGIDLAWKSQNNPSALAFGKLQNNNTLHVVQVHPAITGVEKVLSIIKSELSLSGIAIDAPLIINNQAGQRICEKQLSQAYGAQGASCHTSNLTLYPKPSSVTLSESLSSSGFVHLGELSDRQWQIECYPHPALIEIFGFSRRLQYKKGTVEQQRKGQAQLAIHIKSLQFSPIIRLIIDSKFQFNIDESHILSLQGRKLKENEDVLDALVCLYIAALYAIKVKHVVFGTIENGYIYVPSQLCLEENNVCIGYEVSSDSSFPL